MFLLPPVFLIFCSGFLPLAIYSDSAFDDSDIFEFAVGDSTQYIEHALGGEAPGKIFFHLFQVIILLLSCLQTRYLCFQLQSFQQKVSVTLSFRRAFGAPKCQKK